MSGEAPLDGLETLTRATIWVSLAAWSLSVSWMLQVGRDRIARIGWTCGAIVFVVHVVLAYAAFYDWSHAIAWRETARQSAERTGVESGQGLWLNYAFGLVWLLDAAVWWIRGTARDRARPAALEWALHGFMVFMIVNGAVIFVDGPRRWLGVAVLAAPAGLAATRLASRTRSRTHSA